MRIVRDVAYGPHPQQRFDLYAPRQVQRAAPVIFLVHGGGWRGGDKATDGVVGNKAARWVAAGMIVVSTNYRLLPAADPLTQAHDVASALATAQSAVVRYGGDPDRFVLMGHSAGAHVALLAASPAFARSAGAHPWLGSVLLDSAAVDVVTLMKRRHLPLYDRAFGTDPTYWRASSPLHLLQTRSAPLLAVCSTLRADACPSNRSFVDKAAALGTATTLLPQPLSHRQINVELGRENSYTRTIEDFLRRLGIALPRRA